MTMEMKSQTYSPEAIVDHYKTEDLGEIAQKLGRTLLIGNYIADQNDKIATRKVHGAYLGLKNPLDWKVFQEITKWADAIISSTSYVESLKETPENQDVFFQFDKGGAFEKLGDWREQNGLERNPAIIFFSRHPEKIVIPEKVLKDGRTVIVFTTNAASQEVTSKKLIDPRVRVVAAGDETDQVIDGEKVYKYLNEVMQYRVVKLATGPQSLQVIKKVIDVLFETKVDRIISGDQADLVSILLNGEKLSEGSDFSLIR